MTARRLTVIDHGRAAPVDHAAAAERFIADEERTDWHDGALWFLRQRRDAAVAMVPDWESLRENASAIKEHALSQLDTYLEQFERSAIANGVEVHWARDAEEHNRIVYGILEQRGARRLVKSKSMLTEECGLNPYLEARGIEVVDSDLGERIVQLRGEAPSHIVAPAIHLRREDIGDTFHEHLGTGKGASDPIVLVAAARAHLRERFLAADATLTGVNFAVAETGVLVVVTNEGNADLAMSLAPVHIASMGIEKVIPRMADLGVFLRVLARSATGQASTVYASHVRAPRSGQVIHVVLVDNGRSTQLGRKDFWRSLKCIRCGACMNTCPVYRRSGGYSYGATVPGPIGSVLTPGIDLKKYAALPFASTLCGSCTAVCPVKIDLDAQLYRWRQIVTKAGLAAPDTRVVMRMFGAVVSRPRWFEMIGAVVRGLLRAMPHRVMQKVAGPWSRARELPVAPAQSFREWYRTRETPS